MAGLRSSVCPGTNIWFLSPPRQVDAEGMELHYHSPRPGYGAWVVGICEAVARDVFQTWVHFKLVEGRPDGSADHEVGGGLGGRELGGEKGGDGGFHTAVGGGAARWQCRP